MKRSKRLFSVLVFFALGYTVLLGFGHLMGIRIEASPAKIDLLESSITIGQDFFIALFKTLHWVLGLMTGILFYKET